MTLNSDKEKGIVAIGGLPEELLPPIETLTLGKVSKEFSQKSTAELWMMNC